MRDSARVDFQPDLVRDLEDIARRCRDAQRVTARAGRYQVVPMLAEIGALDDATLDPPAAAIAERPPEADALRRTEKSTRRPSLATPGKRSARSEKPGKPISPPASVPSRKLVRPMKPATKRVS